MRCVAGRIGVAALLVGLGALLPLVMLYLAGAWLVSPRFVRGLFDQEGDGGHSTLDHWATDLWVDKARETYWRKFMR